MANSLDRVIVQEGPRNAVVRLTGSLDTSNAILNPAISLTDFSNNDPRLVFTGFRIDRVEFSASIHLGLSIYWASLNPQAIVNAAAEGDFCFSGGLIPDATRLGYTGNIGVNVTGFDVTKPNMFTIQLEMVKLYRT